jgi:formylglycine-generating enzyme required for sulfatase activity
MNQPSTATQAAPPPEPTPEIPAEEVLARSPVVNSIGMSLKVIPAGTFPMGATGGQPDEKPVTDVRIRRPFFIGVTEVTNAQWKKVTEAIPSLSQDENCPVELVTWHQANAFCEALSKLPAEREAGRFYRLPAEAEWEYACRAGTQTQYSFGDSIEQLADHAWCSGNARGRSHPVAQKQPNAWGLHDLHGNVAEWCADQYAAYRTERMFAGPDRESESVRVVRGGGWLLGPEHCRSAVRGAVAPSVSLPHLGFRVVMEMEGRETTAQKIQAGRSADAGNSSVESRWDHSAGGQRGILELHSNGRCKSGTAEGTWETVSGLLVMKWPASNAAGESRVDACTLSPDGLSFSGTSSNTGHRIFGRRLDSDEANANPR